ncbi:hypothetical protein P7H20_26130, partial [Paenibacillus larvae]
TKLSASFSNFRQLCCTSGHLLRHVKQAFFDFLNSSSDASTVFLTPAKEFSNSTALVTTDFSARADPANVAPNTMERFDPTL